MQSIFVYSHDVFLTFSVIYFTLSSKYVSFHHANTQTTKDAIDLVDYVHRSKLSIWQKLAALIEMKIDRRAWSRRMIMKNWGEGRDKFLARIVD